MGCKLRSIGIKCQVLNAIYYKYFILIGKNECLLREVVPIK